MVLASLQRKKYLLQKFKMWNITNFTNNYFQKIIFENPKQHSFLSKYSSLTSVQIQIPKSKFQVLFIQKIKFYKIDII